MERSQRWPIDYSAPLSLEIPDVPGYFAHGFASFRRPAGSLFWLLAALAASGCGHEAKIDFTTVTKPPIVQVINPPVRTIVRVVGQPSFIESVRAHVGFSQADRLYREVERGYRRQGEEG